MEFKELDSETRKWMLVEFETEEKNRPYRSPRLSTLGKEKFAEIMRKAIRTGDILSLTDDLLNSSFWNTTESYERNGEYRTKNIPRNAPKLLAHTEFTTWYTRGFARRLMEEGIDSCIVYRAEPARTPRCECTRLEGKLVKVKDVYNGHRSGYHYPLSTSALSIPNGPLCHHTIQRLKS